MRIPHRAAFLAAAAVLSSSFVAGSAAADPGVAGSGLSVISGAHTAARALEALAVSPRVAHEGAGVPAAPAAEAPAAPAAKGECFRMTVRQRNLGLLPKKPIDCAKPHDLEVAKVYRLPGKLARAGWGAPPVYAWATTKCQVYGVPGYRGTAQVTLDFMGVVIFPTAKQWKTGQRWAVCGGASLDSRFRAQRSAGSIKDVAEPRGFCIRKTGGASECVPGTIRWTNAFQIYPNAWAAKYPGKKALAKRMEAKAATYVEPGQPYYVSLPASRADWEDGFGRWAFVGVPA